MIVPAAVPIAAELVIVEAVFNSCIIRPAVSPSSSMNSSALPSLVPASKTNFSVAFSVMKPLFKAIAFAPIESTSPASVAALPAAIASSNVSLFVPEPLAYDNV